ncbi:hypothetical protein [Streptomyces alboniger]|uniref:hypothetical protein n=1 Tax=Streptomyces alboniger TaxID=132473 RepID=UPI000AB57BC7|nr:hypothetical protein [Streptomyces alboniger]
MGVVVTAAVALVAGYLLGRLRPWQRLGDWAADQVRFTGAWVRGGFGRQAVVVLVHAVTAPRTSWRIMRTPATETRTPTPARDPDWGANRSRGEHE